MWGMRCGWYTMEPLKRRSYRSTNQLKPTTHNERGNPMTSNQSNKYAMYSAAANVLKSHASRTTAIPAFAGSYDRFGGLLTQISDKDKERMGKTSGKVAAKDEAEDSLVMGVMIVSSGLTALARAKGNVQLKGAAHVAESPLRHARPSEQINIGKLTYDLAKANEEDLAQYGISSTMLEDLKTRIGAYETAVKDVASGLAERTGAKTAVSDLFVQADQVLREELDPMMQIFRVTDPEFYNDYRAARVIRDIGVRHNKAGQAAAPAPGQPN